MAQQELPGGIASRVTGLSAALLGHILAIVALAADETRALIQRSLISVILLVALILSLAIAYLALVLTAIALLTFSLRWNLVWALGAASVVHVVFAAILLTILRLRKKTLPFEATTEELRRDLEALNSYTRRSGAQPPFPKTTP